MASEEKSLPSPNPSAETNPFWNRLSQRLFIWAGFLLLIYVLRDFFFTAFMTFLICYYTLAVVEWGMQRLSPNRERIWLRRALTVAIFALVPLTLFGIGVLISPHVIKQGQRLSGWIRYSSPESEAGRLLEDFVGPVLFQMEYGNSASPAFREALEKFREKGERHLIEYFRFPRLEAYVEGAIFMPVVDDERDRIKSWLLSEGTSSQAFTDWFLREKAPEIAAEAKLDVPTTGRPTTDIPPLVRAAASSSPAQLLEMVRRDPPMLESLRLQWIEDTLKYKFDTAKKSPAFVEQLRQSFEQQRESLPETMPYSFDEFTELSAARPLGRVAFADVLDRIRPSPPSEKPEDKEQRLLADFESAARHELFQQWWSSNSIAKFLRHKLESMVDPSAASGRIESILGALLNIPVALATAFTLSIFICIDYVNLKKSLPHLRRTWLKDIYEEVAPAIVDMGNLIGRFMQLQGTIALISALLMTVGLLFLGVQHALLLGIATFVLCLVPTLGSILAIILIVIFALFQYGGGLGLAVEAGVMGSIVSLIESFVLSPRILGTKMDLHPVILVTVLPLAQYFFGIWGLILATPVAVYAVNFIILQRGLPGQPSARLRESTVRDSDPLDEKKEAWIE